MIFVAVNKCISECIWSLFIICFLRALFLKQCVELWSCKIYHVLLFLFLSFFFSFFSSSINLLSLFINLFIILQSTLLNWLINSFLNDHTFQSFFSFIQLHIINQQVCCSSTVHMLTLFHQSHTNYQLNQQVFLLYLHAHLLLKHVLFSFCQTFKLSYFHTCHFHISLMCKIYSRRRIQFMQLLHY